MLRFARDESRGITKDRYRIRMLVHLPVAGRQGENVRITLHAAPGRRVLALDHENVDLEEGT